MSSQDPESKTNASLLSRALRAVRAIRNVSSRELAKALGLSLRGYQHFEAGGGQLNFDHVMRFSRAMDCDPMGVLLAIRIGKPEFAAYVAQNKAMIAYVITLQEFVEETGEAIARLETTDWVSAYRETFKGLSAQAIAAQADHDAWLAQNSARINLLDDDPAKGATEGDAPPKAGMGEDKGQDDGGQD